MILSLFLVLGKTGGGVLFNQLMTFQSYRRELPGSLFTLDKRYPYLEPNERNGRTAEHATRDSRKLKRSLAQRQCSTDAIPNEAVGRQPF